MHPTTTLFLANASIAELYREAERERLASTARARHRGTPTLSRPLGQLPRRQPQPVEELAC